MGSRASTLEGKFTILAQIALQHPSLRAFATKMAVFLCTTASRVPSGSVDQRLLTLIRNVGPANAERLLEAPLSKLRLSNISIRRFWSQAIWEYLQLGQLADAERLYSKAQGLGIQVFPPTKALLGQLLAKAGKLDAALAIHSTMEPRTAGPAFNGALRRLLTQARRISDAIPLFPTQSGAHPTGTLSPSTDDASEAAVAEAARADSNRNLGTLSSISRHTRAGEHMAAVKALEDAVQRSPELVWHDAEVAHLAESAAISGDVAAVRALLLLRSRQAMLPSVHLKTMEIVALVRSKDVEAGLKLLQSMRSSDSSTEWPNASSYTWVTGALRNCSSPIDQVREWYLEDGFEPNANVYALWVGSYRIFSFVLLLSEMESAQPDSLPKALMIKHMRCSKKRAVRALRTPTVSTISPRRCELGTNRSVLWRFYVRWRPRYHFVWNTRALCFFMPLVATRAMRGECTIRSSPRLLVLEEHR